MRKTLPKISKQDQQDLENIPLKESFPVDCIVGKPLSIVTNEDCMIMMKRYPDKFFELAVVDPPYGAGNFVTTMNIKKDRHKAVDWNDGIPEKEYFDELYRVSKNRIIWGVNNYSKYVEEVGRIIWNKLGPDMFRRRQNGLMSEGEIASQSFNKLIKFYDYTWLGNVRGNNYRVDWENSYGIIHPCQKPILLYEWIYYKYANEGDKILDTHLGSGSSRIAAYKANLDFYGCELDEDHYEAQEERFKKFVSQLTLW